MTVTPTPAPSPQSPQSPPPSGDADPAITALQTTLAAEHAAVFVYGVLGGQTSQSGSPALYAALTSAYTIHRTRRDDLMARLHAAGVDPVAAEPGYGLPADLGTPEGVTARARALEESAAATYAYLVASTTEDARTWAIDALLDAAVRGLGFGARPDRLPGL
ncbi:ferritin-like domain-containing protein [Nocardioides humi]|uniref:Ferritin-like domain-containing protein n=1 Tax=Nocardioides humi TaxID=449461 RepID=A0ABN2ARW3_9ACTN|nr:ferritin-like domain-containing protein [Nocardioides humi]